MRTHLVNRALFFSVFLLLALVIIPLGASADILPADRLAGVNWANAGMKSKGGIPNRTTICATLTAGNGTTDDSSRIQTAIDNCPAGQVVMLGAGTFVVNSPVMISKGITLRGSGAGVTTLAKTNGARGRASTVVTGNLHTPVNPDSYTQDNNPVIIIGPSRWNNGPDGTTSQNLAANAQAGSYSVTVPNGSAFKTGELVLLDELAGATWQATPAGFPSGAQVLQGDKAAYNIHNPEQSGDDPDISRGWFSRFDRPTSEIKEIASISGNTITFTSPITIDYRVNHTAQLTRYTMDPNTSGHSTSNTDVHVLNAGVENFTVKGGASGQIQFESAAYSWAKGIENTEWIGAGFDIDNSFRVEIRDSSIHTASWPVPGGGGYGLSLAHGSSEVLFENNIVRDANKIMVFRSTGAGSVVAYNYTDDGWIYGIEGWVEIGINASHMTGGHHVLFEGNYSFNADSDFTHGNAIHMTFFRNWLSGVRSSFPSDATTGNHRTVGLAYGSWWDSFVGNVLGRPGQMSGYDYTNEAMSCDANGNNCTGNNANWYPPGNTIWELGYDPARWSMQPDPKVLSTVIRDGNYDFLTNSQRWHNTPAGFTIPNSLYLTSKPAFFGTNAWPWVDPSTGTTHTLPAKYCFERNMMPTCLQSGGSTPPPPPSTPTPTATLSANPATITAGQSSTITWSSTNATSCTGTGFSASGTSGSVSVSPTANTTYSITCTGAGGSTNTSATVTVQQPAPQPTGSLTAAQLQTINGKRVYFAHQSVGGNIMSGLTTVYNSLGVAQPRQIYDSQLATTQGGAFADGAVGTNGDALGKTAAFVASIRGGIGNLVDIAFFKYCYVDITASTNVQSLFNDYKAKMSALEHDYPNVKFIYVTAPLTTYDTDINLRREQFNQLMRAEYASTGRLFDLAAVESTAPDGTRVSGTTGGNTYYRLYSGYSADGGHLNSTGSAVAAKEMLTVIARALGSSSTGSGTGTTPDTSIPSTPSNLSASASSASQITLSWTASTDNVGVTGYRVYRGGTQVGTATTNNYSDTGLTAATTYAYTVAAYDAAGNTSARSSSVSATTPAAVTTPPPTISSTGGIVLTRNLQQGDTGKDVRKLQQWLNTHGFAVAQSGPGSLGQETTTFGPATKNAVISFQQSQGLPTTGYVGPLTRTALAGYEVTSTSGTPASGNDQSVESMTIAQLLELIRKLQAQIASLTAASSTPTTTPSQTAKPTVSLSLNISSITTGGSATLTWSSTNATACSGTNFTPTGTNGSVTVSPTVSTTYSITCTGAGGSTSNSATLTVSTTPQNQNQTPTVTLTASPTSITAGQSSTISWNSTNATQCTGNGFTATGVSGSTSVSPTQTTTYSMTCTGTGGTSPSASATVSVTASADTSAPTVPTSVTASAASATQINLSWTASTDNVGVTGYRVYRGGTQIGTATTNSYNDTGLTPNTAYAYTVAAYDAAGNTSTQSSSASATTQANTTSNTANSTTRFVQTVKTVDTSHTATVTSSTITTSADAFLVVSVALWSQDPTPPTITSITLDGTTQFTVDKQQHYSGSNEFRVAIASLAHVPDGTHTVTVNTTGLSMGATIFVSEFAGPITAADGSASDEGWGSTPSSGTFTSTGSNDLWVGGFVTDLNFTTPTPGSGWTVPTNGFHPTDGGMGQPRGGFSYRIANGSTSDTASWTTSGGNWAAAGVAYK